jgi:Zn/Cd-binding protein ZinT
MQHLIDFFEQENYVVRTFTQDGQEILELGTWTEGGVNMCFELHPPTAESFEQYVNYFDVDEEIEHHRRDSRYSTDFTIRQGLEDFEAFEERLKQTLLKLKELEIPTN